MSYTSSNSVLDFRVLYRTRPIKSNPTIPTTTTASTWIFSAQDTTTNNAAPTISAIIACLCCVILLMVFQRQHCQISYQGMVLFQWKVGYQSHLALSLSKHFELLHCFHIQIGKCQDFCCLY